MRNQREKALRLLCLLLGALLAFQLTHFLLHGNPARGLFIPSVPFLPVQAEISGTNASKMDSKGKKSEPIAQNSTNQNISMNSASNAATPSAKATEVGNALKPNGATNSALPPSQGSRTNQSTNEVKIATVANSASEKGDRAPATNSATTVTATNSSRAGTNLVAGASGTNSASTNAMTRTNGPPSHAINMAGKTPPLPAEIKERVDRIVNGEILGQVIRPMPMALLGIAGPYAFLRSPEGQTGMVKEGDSLGTIKLLTIGTNRVLIEHEGDKKELMIFAGLGGETLLPKKESKTNETTSSKSM